MLPHNEEVRFQEGGFRKKHAGHNAHPTEHHPRYPGRRAHHLKAKGKESGPHTSPFRAKNDSTLQTQTSKYAGRDRWREIQKGE